jgi:hypothetical protein
MLTRTVTGHTTSTSGIAHSCPPGVTDRSGDMTLSPARSSTAPQASRIVMGPSEQPSRVSSRSNAWSGHA